MEEKDDGGRSEDTSIIYRKIAQGQKTLLRKQVGF
jgi:hypothetical protein